MNSLSSLRDLSHYKFTPLILWSGFITMIMYTIATCALHHIVSLYCILPSLYTLHTTLILSISVPHTILLSHVIDSPHTLPAPRLTIATTHHIVVSRQTPHPPPAPPAHHTLRSHRKQARILRKKILGLVPQTRRDVSGASRLEEKHSLHVNKAKLGPTPRLPPP